MNIELLKNILISIFITLYMCIFIYSGINKIKTFPEQSKNLSNKLSISKNLANIGIGSVIFLEVFLAALLILYFAIVPYLRKYGKITKKVANDLTYTMISIVTLFIIFMITVTILYHLPKDGINTFLSKLTVTAGFGLILTILLDSIEE